MSNKERELSNSQRGTVVEVSRRFVKIVAPSRSIITGIVSSKNLEVVVGDVALFEERDGDIFVTEVASSERGLYRSVHGKLKKMGSNIDRLMVITASGPTFNPVVIDRMLVAARARAIPATLVINKIDLGLSDLEEMIAVYRRIGIPVLLCSAKKGQGMAELRAIIDAPEVEIVSLCGVSGVGKSTILNALVPGAKTKTGDVSAKTGQGKQTTTQPRGHLYTGSEGLAKVIVDLPGVQFFGLSHLSDEEARLAFQEMSEVAEACRFGDCKHVQEPECAVKVAVARGEIASWRYESYLQILNEIAEVKQY